MIIKNNNYVLTIEYDSDSENPRDWENLGTMCNVYGRNNFGCELKYDDFSDFIYNLLDEETDARTYGELEEDLKNRLDEEYILYPIYVYSHSNVALSMKSFNDHWDSGLLGFIYVSKVKAENEYCDCESRAKLNEVVYKVFENELSTLEKYLNGEVYGFTLEHKEVCKCCGHELRDTIDSCWGFYDLNDIIDEVKEYGFTSSDLCK